MDRVFITGITGQDGSFLAEQQLAKGREVVGLIRRSSTDNLWRIKHLLNDFNLQLEYGDLLDRQSIDRIVKEYQPTHTYHLAAQSHVGLSFEIPDYTFQVVVTGTYNVLESLYQNCSFSRFYHASSSEQFGANINEYGFQDEETEFMPVSPYAVAKTMAHRLTSYYRETNRLWTCTGVLLNHESNRRGENFVTRKITKYLSELVSIDNHKIVVNKIPKLKLGNLSAKRDWGWAPDYTRAMDLMMHHTEGDNFVIATGQTYEITDFLDVAFGYYNLNYRNFIEIDPALYRPNEVPYLRGDSTKARTVLGWMPTISFEELVVDMVKSDAKI